MTDLDERTRLGRALNDIDLSIHSKMGVDDVMQAALDSFVTTLGADAGDIKLVEGDTWVVRYERGFGQQEVGVRLSIPEAPVAVKVAELREPVIIEDYLAEPAGFYVGFPLKHRLRAVVAMPLIIRDDVVGCLFAWMRHAPRTFSPAEVDFARRMAASVALALENARLFEAEREARKRAEEVESRLAQELERTSLLLRASDELTTATNSDELLERLASIVLDATGIDRAFVNLIDMRRRVLTPKVATGGLVAPAGSQIPFSKLSRTARRAIVDKRLVLLDYELPDVPEEDRAIAQANSARLVLFVPLVHQGEVVGHVSLDQPGVRYAFGTEQVRIVGSIAAQAAVALGNLRQYEREHRIAEVLQQAILTPPEEIDALDVAYLYEPASAAASVGGDFYDLFDLGDGRAAVLIGDVAGKGVRAARLTTLIRDGARAYLLEDAEPSSVLLRLNALAFRFTPPERFATIFLGVLNYSTGSLRYCGVGHPPPVVVERSEAPRMLESDPGLLGALPDWTFESQQTVLAAGATLCLVTDGVTEARRGERMFGEAGVADALAQLHDVPVARLPEALLEQVLAFTGGGLRDDVVILCVARKDSRTDTVPS